jgi:peptidyl-tRNA hydrolase
MTELEDYSGPYRPDEKFADFSKDALVMVLHNYQKFFIGLMAMWNSAKRQRMSVEGTWKLDAEVYDMQLRQFEMSLFTQTMNIHGNGVVTMLKYFQMCPDG